MTARIVLGRQIQKELVATAFADGPELAVPPRCRLVSVAGPDPMLDINRALHVRTLTAAGLACDDVCLPVGSPLERLREVLAEANSDPDVDGVMVLMPLPEHLRVGDVLPLIDPDKELEGLHPQHNSALLAPNHRPAGAVRPLVPEAILEILGRERIDLADKHVVVLTEAGLMDSNPVANLVVRAASAAVLPTSAPLSLVPIDHPRAREIARGADVLVVSLEHPERVGADYVGPGAVVIDFNPTLVGLKAGADGKPVPDLRGGVDTAAAVGAAGVVVPVPGGAGPVMLGILMRNLIRNAQRRAALVPVG